LRGGGLVLQGAKIQTGKRVWGWVCASGGTGKKQQKNQVGQDEN